MATPHADPSFVHRMTEANGVRLHHVLAPGRGEGPRPLVVLLHGFPSTWHEWRLVMPSLAAAGYDALAVDLRGMGDSARPRGSYDAFTLAADVHALVRSGLGRERAFVVGHDVGAPVAWAYAASWPDEVPRLAVLELVLAGAGLEELVRDAGARLWHFAFQSVPDLPEALVAGREALYMAELFRPYTRNPGAITDEAFAEYVRAYAQPGAMRAGFDYYRDLPRTAERVRDHLAGMGKIQMPVLALAGSHSMGSDAAGHPARASVGRVAAEVTYEVVPDCGHWIPEERPEWLADRLVAFFGGAR